MITRRTSIPGNFSDIEYASIVYQILNDARDNNELVQEILLFPGSINFRTISLNYNS